MVYRFSFICDTDYDNAGLDWKFREYTTTPDNEISLAVYSGEPESACISFHWGSQAGLVISRIPRHSRSSFWICRLVHDTLVT